MTLSVGKTRYSEGGDLGFKVYTTGHLAITVFDPDTGEPICHATCNMPEYPAQQNCVWIKNWSENEGIWQALIAAKIVSATGRQRQIGHVAAQEALLTPATLEAVKASGLTPHGIIFA